MMTMMPPRLSPQPQPRPRSRRPRTTTRLLLLLSCGLLWVVACWSYIVLSSFASSPPPDADVAAASRPDFAGTGPHNRHLSSSDDAKAVTYKPLVHANENEAQHHLRGTVGQAARIEAPRPGSTLNHSAPRSAFVYPLHERSGTHHAYLYVGTPPQRQTLIVDTGSRLTAFPCRPHCPDCGTHASPPFQLNASASHAVVACDACRLDQVDFTAESRGAFPRSCVHDRCELDQKYTEGSSWTAFEVEDKVWLGSDDRTRSAAEHREYAAPFTFGCQTSERGLFGTQYADGIMGLSMYTQTLVGAWRRRAAIPRPAFSLCLNHNGGHMAIGGTGGSHESSPEEGRRRASAGRHLEPMQFTPFSKDSVWHYAVMVTSISVGKHVLPERLLPFVNDRKGTIVDSGTTDTFISRKLAKPFSVAWEHITGKKYHNRLQKFTFQQFEALPVITFTLEGGVRWDIRPGAYMEAAEAASRDGEAGTGRPRDAPQRPWEGKRGFTNRVYVDEPHGVVLGSNAMLDKEVYFDLEHRRLGVARATCAY